jgi:hypothetical protein
MFGQANECGHRYYRHAHTDRIRQCPLRPRPWVRADQIEAAVVGDLFNMLGNPAAIERAIKSAIPDCDKTMQKRQRLEDDLAKIDKARNRVLTLIEKDALTDAQAEGKLKELKEREVALSTDLDVLAATLADIPDAETVRHYVDVMRFKNPDRGVVLVDGMKEPLPIDDIEVYDEHGHAPGGNDLITALSMTYSDQQALVDSVFNTTMPDGRPAGVYVTRVAGATWGPKKFSYQLRGRLVGQVMPCAWYCKAPGPLGRRSCGQSPRPLG